MFVCSSYVSWHSMLETSEKGVKAMSWGGSSEPPHIGVTAPSSL